MASDLTFTQVKGSFVLRRRADNGRGVAIRLSPEEVLGLEKTIALWRDQLLTQHKTESGSVSPLVVHSTVGAEIQTDAMRANVLLTVGTPSGARMTFSLPPPVAEYVAAATAAALAEIGAMPAR